MLLSCKHLALTTLAAPALALALAGCGPGSDSQAVAAPAVEGHAEVGSSAADTVSADLAAPAAPAPAGAVDAGIEAVADASAVAPAAPVPAAPVAAAPAPQFARVVAVTPVTAEHTMTTPRQECRDEEVPVDREFKDKNRIGGAVAGGAIGGLLGHQVGGGRGKDLATLAGVVGGAVAGREIQKRHQENNAVETETRRVCQTVDETHVETVTTGYDVTWQLGDEEGHVHMAEAPLIGTGLPVIDGKVAVPVD